MNGWDQRADQRGDYRRQKRNDLRKHWNQRLNQLAESVHQSLNRRLQLRESVLQRFEDRLQHVAELRAQSRAGGDQSCQSANHQRDGTAKTAEHFAQATKHAADDRHSTQAAQRATKTSRAKQTGHGGDGTGQRAKAIRQAAEINLADLVSDSTEHLFQGWTDLLGQRRHLIKQRCDERFDGLHHLDDRAADTTESRDEIIADRSLQPGDLMLENGHLALRGLRQGLVDATEVGFQDLRGHGCLFGRAALLQDFLLRVGHGHAIFRQCRGAAGHDLAEQVGYLHAILRRRVIAFVVGDHVRQSGRQRLDLIGRQREGAELCLSGLQGAAGYDAGLAKRLVQAEQGLLLFVRPIVVFGDLLEFRGHLSGLERRIDGLASEVDEVCGRCGGRAGHDGGHALRGVADTGHGLGR